ncbi:MAG: hypothetical protein LBF09_06920 [Odoribacteraceae bacterium]|jgi:hypothetical protein|nr:hypothetical protein [Odoribacteraceae bacterium]
MPGNQLLTSGMEAGRSIKTRPAPGIVFLAPVMEGGMPLMEGGMSLMEEGMPLPAAVMPPAGAGVAV